MCLRLYKITGYSMAPSLKEGARVVTCTRWPLQLGDVVICRQPSTGRETVKRLVHISGDKYFVEGDNLAMSTDSRHFGPVRKHDIISRVMFQYFPAIQIIV